MLRKGIHMKDTSTFLYFAYGSNMFEKRLKCRVGSAEFVSVAALSGHELRWHIVSKDGSGKCDIVQVETPKSVVHGVVYKILSSEKAALDCAEGFGQGYEEKQVVLETATGKIQAYTYYATNTNPEIAPYTWYKALVIAGAKEHGFPADYISELEAVVAKIDPNKHREAKELAILDCAGQ